MSTTAKLKSLDFYRKIPRDLTEATLSGAGLSIIAALSMVFLFGMELNTYLRLSTTTSVIVDQSMDGDFLRINFNFSFPSLSCEFASVDVTDVLGTARFNLTKTIKKFPINANFQVVGPEHHPGAIPTVSKHGEENQEEAKKKLLLLQEEGDNAGALVITEQTFDQIAHEYPILIVNFFAPWCPWSQRLEPSWEMAAAEISRKYHPINDGRIRLGKIDCTKYLALCRRHHIQGFPSIRIFRKGIDLIENHGHHEHESYYGERDKDSLVKFAESLLPPATIEEHIQREEDRKQGKTSTERRRAPQSGGCHIEGFVLVKKVPGNLMVSASSRSHSFDASTMNLTHRVSHFSFGRPLPVKKQKQLDRLLPHLPGDKDRMKDHLFISQHKNVTHDHFLQVVMTEVVPYHSFEIKKNKNSLQSYDYTVHSNTLQAHSVPVARFHYEVSPMQVLIKENSRSFSHFITNVCAIVGGVFTVAGIVDSLLHNFLKVWKKQGLGKQY